MFQFRGLFLHSRLLQFLKCSTSFPGGNQVDGLPPASSMVELACFASPGRSTGSNWMIYGLGHTSYMSPALQTLYMSRKIRWRFNLDDQVSMLGAIFHGLGKNAT